MMSEARVRAAAAVTKGASDKLEASIASATEALCALQRADGHFVFELEADATIPAEYVLIRHYLRRAGRCRARAEDRALSPSHSIARWRLAAVPCGRVRYQRERQSLFRAEDDRRPRRRPAYGARTGLDPRPWRRRQQQCVHAQSARALWGHPVARRAGDAGRDHAPAALVSVPSRQGLLLGTHRDGAADGAECP